MHPRRLGMARAPPGESSRREVSQSKPPPAAHAQQKSMASSNCAMPCSSKPAIAGQLARVGARGGALARQPEGELGRAAGGQLRGRHVAPHQRSRIGLRAWRLGQRAQRRRPRRRPAAGLAALPASRNRVGLFVRVRSVPLEGQAASSSRARMERKARADGADCESEHAPSSAGRLDAPS